MALAGALSDLVKRIREEFRRSRELTHGQIRKLCERLTDDHRKIGKAIHHLEMCGDIEQADKAFGPGRPTTRWKSFAPLGSQTWLSFFNKRYRSPAAIPISAPFFFETETARLMFVQRCWHGFRW